MRIGPTPLELNPATRNDPAKVEKVARQLEGQFAQMLIKSMREASFGDSLFPGENQMFREMYDQRIAEAMTKGRGLGLSSMIARQLGGGDATTVPAVDTRITPANAARAYQIEGATGPARGLPLQPAAPSMAPAGFDTGVLPAPLPGSEGVSVLDPMAQTLDLIAGRESSSMHAALGQQDPYTGTDSALAMASQDNWAMADDRWSGVQKPATAGTTGAVDMLASTTAAAQLGTHTPEGFVASIWGHAQQAARELGVDPRALVAQAALETGWGRKLIRKGGDSAHNLFGIKATGWSGARTNATTHEYVGGVRQTEVASFRAYTSPAESFADYVRLLKTSPRYQQALQAGTDVQGFARGLQRAGYATDPGYAAKIAAIAGGPTIERAVAAVGDAGQRLGRTFASAAGQTVAGLIRR